MSIHKFMLLLVRQDLLTNARSTGPRASEHFLHTTQAGRQAGGLLVRFKSDFDRPCISKGRCA